mgnify:CR=1 FL=1|jgi:prolyl oligopeptidase
MRKFYKPNILYCLIITALLFSCSASEEAMKYPESKKVDLIEILHDTKVEDPYRWLEDFTSGESLKWVEEQNIFSDSYLSNNKYKQSIKNQLEKIWITDTMSMPIIRSGKTFYYFNDGSHQQDILMIQDCESCDSSILLDPNTFSEDGTISLSSASISPNGKLIAYSVSDGGSDWRTWYVMDIDTKKKMSDEILWSKFSNATWSSDSSGFFYQGYPEPEELLVDINRSPLLYFHEIGRDQGSDVIEYQDSLNPNWSWDIIVPNSGEFKLLNVSEGTDERNLVYIKFKNSDNYLSVIDEFKGAYRYLDSKENIAWFYTTDNAPKGKVVVLDISDRNNFKWKDVVKEAEETISSVNVVGKKIIVNYLKDTLSLVSFFNLSGSFIQNLELNMEGSVQGFDGDMNDDYTFFEFTNFISPSKIFRLDLKEIESVIFWEMKVPELSEEDLETEMNFFSSKDGTNIPVHISHKKDLKIDNKTPILLYGYGGFNISILPNFSKVFYTWMKQGGVLAVVNLRGGGEYGDKWHQEGMLLNKNNVFDDFAFAAKYLHEINIGSPQTTVSLGGSNGGLLVAATMLQYPDLFKVVIPQVGVLDMLRFHKFTIGWAWESDYGSPEEEVHFNNLLSYSPYHNIEEGVCYPTTLITTSSRDDRVVPAHSYKFAARLQEYQDCSNPILLRVESRAGHGAGTPKDKKIEEIADIYGFALSEINKDLELDQND